MPELEIDLEKLPKVSTVISEMVANGPHKHIYKEIYGKGNPEQIQERKQIFEWTLDLYEKQRQEKAEEEKVAWRAKTL